ncbi:helix-turn-helix transcriptional regulator [Streptomyces sp. AK02-01A]|uniref:helix-turn-helix domain-containing protein n=1 Tax=Streptomyces sp. AK02-01A TaxID=3028648 RepID=UPI0029B2682D|nr:helix-turn-helix transcriptional regulator [Streptomyces sp. AK02-01A]MDX3850305.1 helix-turn-helix transcriptional regulator [Streptomyces sp. AK02-01A]
MRTLFGHRLKRLRLAAGLTQEALGTRVRVHSTRITQIERATATMPTLPLTQQLDEAVRADGLLVDLWPHMYRENFPDWSRAYMAAEAEAVAIWAYMGQPVHGLLQTPEYARAMLRLGRSLRTPEQLEQRVSSRLARQERLRAADAPQLWVILDEAVFLRPVGGPAVMRGQMARLLEAAKEPHITLQVLPFSHGEHAAMGGSLNILDLPDGGTVAYTEGADSGQLIDEPEEVKPYTVNYDFLRAEALPSTVSLDLIRSVMEDNYRAARVPTRSQRRRLAQVQSQQSGGRGLRRGR